MKSLYFLIFVCFYFVGCSTYNPYEVFYRNLLDDNEREELDEARKQYPKKELEILTPNPGYTVDVITDNAVKYSNCVFIGYSNFTGEAYGDPYVRRHAKSVNANTVLMSKKFLRAENRVDIRTEHVGSSTTNVYNSRGQYVGNIQTQTTREVPYSYKVGIYHHEANFLYCPSKLLR